MLTREQDRDRKRRLRQDPAFRERENAQARERMARLNRARGVPTREEYLASARSSRTPGSAPHREVDEPRRESLKPRPGRVPWRIWNAYVRADENSIIRRKFPTYADLRYAFGGSA